MPGRHKFVPAAGVGGVPCCEYCGESKTGLDLRRVEGQLPLCLDAPCENVAQAGKFHSH
jgi:hypothetical protein